MLKKVNVCMVYCVYGIVINVKKKENGKLFLGECM